MSHIWYSSLMTVLCQYFMFYLNSRPKHNHLDSHCHISRMSSSSTEYCYNCLQPNFMLKRISLDYSKHIPKKISSRYLVFHCAQCSEFWQRQWIVFNLIKYLFSNLFGGEYLKINLSWRVTKKNVTNSPLFRMSINLSGYRNGISPPFEPINKDPWKQLVGIWNLY